MALGTAKILGPQGANMVGDDGELTDAARVKFVTDVASLLLLGNEDGLSLQKTSPLWVIPTPPVPGPPLVIDILKPEPEFLFWFKSQPFALLSIPILSDKEKEYQKLIINTLYAPLVKMMNLDGKTSLGPIIDPSIVIDLSKFPNLTIPDLPGIMAKIFIQVNIGTPAAQLNLNQNFGIGAPQFADLLSLVTKVPDISPPGFSIPSIPVPTVPNLGLPSFVLPDLILQILLIPVNLIVQLMSLITSPDIDPLALLKKILQLIIDIILDILKKLGLLVGLPKILSATLAVLIKNLAGMLLCDVVGSLLGTGAIVKIVASLVGVT